MRLIATTVLAVLALASSPVRGDDAFDPTHFILSQPSTANPPPEKLVQQSEVLINGRPFWRFQSAEGSLYVPKVAYVSREEFERALCNEGTQKPKCDLTKPVNQWRTKAGPRIPEECVDEGQQGTTALRVERPLDRNLVAYADAIVLAIQRPCGTGAQPTPSLSGPTGMEIGIEEKNAGRAPGSKKVFLRSRPVENPRAPSAAPGLKPALGFGLSF